LKIHERFSLRLFFLGNELPLFLALRIRWFLELLIEVHYYFNKRLGNVADLNVLGSLHKTDLRDQSCLIFDLLAAG
jgi:hypothetical protein